MRTEGLLEIQIKPLRLLIVSRAVLNLIDVGGHYTPNPQAWWNAPGGIGHWAIIPSGLYQPAKAAWVLVCNTLYMSSHVEQHSFPLALV